MVISGMGQISTEPALEDDGGSGAVDRASVDTTALSRATPLSQGSLGFKRRVALIDKFDGQSVTFAELLRKPPSLAGQGMLGTVDIIRAADDQSVRSMLFE